MSRVTFEQALRIVEQLSYVDQQRLVEYLQHHDARMEEVVTDLGVFLLDFTLP